MDTDYASSEGGLPLHENIQVYWNSDFDFDHAVRVLIQGENWQFPQYLNINVPNSNSYHFELMERWDDSLGQHFKIWIWYSPSVFNVSEEYILADACGYTGCGTHGTCSIGGLCECQQGFKGKHCESSICDDNLKCENNGWCTNKECSCLPGFTGPTCGSVETCLDTINCVQGDALLVDGSCTCQCYGHYSGQSCDHCELNCENNGLPNNDCSQCVCTEESVSPPAFYYTGSTCDCAALQIEMVLDIKMNFTSFSSDLTTTGLSNAQTKYQLGRTLANDIEFALNLSGFDLVKTLSISEPTLAASMLVTIELKYPCSRTMILPEPFVVLYPDDEFATLFYWANTLNNMTEDAESVLKQGLMGQFIRTNSVIIPSSPSEAESTSGLIIGLVIVLCVSIFTLFILKYLPCGLYLPDRFQQLEKDAPVPKDTEEESHGKLYRD